MIRIGQSAVGASRLVPNWHGDFVEIDQVWSRCIWLEPASAKLAPAWLKTGLGRDLGRAKVHLARPLSSGVKFDDFDEFGQVWSRCIWLEPASAKLT